MAAIFSAGCSADYCTAWQIGFSAAKSSRGGRGWLIGYLSGLCLSNFFNGSKIKFVKGIIF
jgi:hypothetical protein